MTPQVLQTLSQVAIVVGLVLTGLGGFGAYYYGKAIDAQRDASTAERETALKADIRKLLEGNDSLQKRLEPFERLAGELHPTLAKDQALQQLREDLNIVKNKTAVLEQRTAPRALSEQQKRVITESLRSAAASTVEISSVMGDGDAFTLANELMRAIEGAGWKVDGVNQAVFSIPVKGIVISVGQQPAPPAANQLFTALQRAGITATGNVDPNRKDAGVSLWIGSKQ